MNKDFKTIYSNLDEKNANLVLLVLASQNIETRIEQGLEGFDIMVDASKENRAVSIMSTYYKENKWFRIRQAIEQIPLSSFSSAPAFILMGMLCFIHWACIYYHGHERMVLNYGASALYIIQGETFRAVTALLLHADLEHLMGNLAGILIFSAPVIRISGYGMGPFMLLFGGTLGNLLNAHMQQNAHLSIGASTMVMASAGLLCAFQALNKQKVKKLNSIMPIFAGAILVGLFSQGENTDVWAHIFGFGSGILSGLIFFPLNSILSFPQKDIIAITVTIFIIVSAIRAGV